MIVAFAAGPPLYLRVRTSRPLAVSTMSARYTQSKSEQAAHAAILKGMLKNPENKVRALAEFETITHRALC